MGLSSMIDSSTPPAAYPPVVVVAFYIGGQTPHVWTDAEIADIPASYGLPIWVNINPDGDPEAAAEDCIAWLKAHEWTPGTAVALDVEATEQAYFIGIFASRLDTAGWPVLLYESQSPEAINPDPAAGRWLAVWDGIAHLAPGSVATQFASATMLGTDYDSSVIDQSVPLHLLIPGLPAPDPFPATITVDLPVISIGATGMAVRRLQGLLLAWNAGALSGTLLDGIYGSHTHGGVVQYQSDHGLQVDGVVGPITWTSLLTA